MPDYSINATGATLTKLRTPESFTTISGMCTTCLDGCPGPCEIGRSALRAAEMIYPQPFGQVTAASQKRYPVDLSDFNIMGSAVGAHGVEADPDKALFTMVDLTQSIGRDKGIKVRLPFIVPGLGSTDVAKNNWDGLAIGCALAGVPLTIGENVCGMDVQSTIANGRVEESPDLRRRVELYKKWQRDGYGCIVVQSNVEDTRLGVFEYAIKKLNVKVVELKWGQGAKNIGGEVKIDDLEKAQLLYERGYIVLPNPTDPAVIEAFKAGTFREFERHSRLGMVDQDEFIQAVARLRDLGATHVFLKTGAYRPADLARAVKFASLAKIDLLTIDGAGGGTGMSPWRMMNEWGIPTVELISLARQYCDRLAKRGEYVPDMAVAGGFVLEDQVLKGLALGAPFAKLVGMARSPITAAMVGKTIGRMIDEGNLPGTISKFGNTRDEIFVTAPELKQILNGKYGEVPCSAMGLYTYYARLAQGLKQFMCGGRKFALEHVTRDDICALTRAAADVSGIRYVMDIDKEEVDTIL
ncbi:MAG: FMN-binding glutamate synthase family protein [Armatimonadetes bacterium]|nr:FMN-binding glutamate synthase family protein [Armatimonadota bacterium]